MDAQRVELPGELLPADHVGDRECRAGEGRYAEKLRYMPPVELDIYQRS